MKDILIVDGYNVIFAWPELKALSAKSLEHARLELKNQLLNYGHHKGFLVILVFDGQYATATPSEEYITKTFLEVFTSEGVTADSYIEKEVFERKGKYTNVYVVTSDGAEQNQILGSGGLRIPARELREQIKLAKKEERRLYQDVHRRDQVRIQRNELGSLLDEEIVAKLDKIRLNKK